MRSVVLCTLFYLQSSLEETLLLSRCPETVARRPVNVRSKARSGSVQRYLEAWTPLQGHSPDFESYRHRVRHSDFFFSLGEHIPFPPQVFCFHDSFRRLIMAVSNPMNRHFDMHTLQDPGQPEAIKRWILLSRRFLHTG